MARTLGATGKPKPSPLDGIGQEEFEAVMATEMTDMQRRFCLSYLRHHNAARALREAGSAVAMENSSSLAARVLALPHVAAFIETRQAERLNRLAVTNERIEEELARVAFASMGDILRIQPDGSAYITFEGADADTLSALQSIEIDRVDGGDPEQPVTVLKIKAKMHSKLDALGKLAQIRKMIGPENALAVNVDISEEIRKARGRAGLPVGQNEGDDGTDQ